MKKENCEVGMKVIFGRESGEKTLGIVRKMNPKKCRVEILEDRGRKSVKGQVWMVPYQLMSPVKTNVVPDELGAIYVQIKLKVDKNVDFDEVVQEMDYSVKHEHIYNTEVMGWTTGLTRG
jgi:hypothetical protein